MDMPRGVGRHAQIADNMKGMAEAERPRDSPRGIGGLHQQRLVKPEGAGVVARPPDSRTGPIFGKFDHSNVFWSACKRLGLVTVNAKGEAERRGLTAHHVARRTAATLLVDAGVSTKDRMAAGGWESIEAAERYDLGEQVERSKRALRKLR